MEENIKKNIVGEIGFELDGSNLSLKILEHFLVKYFCGFFAKQNLKLLVWCESFFLLVFADGASCLISKRYCFLFWHFFSKYDSNLFSFSAMSLKSSQNILLSFSAI